MPALTLRLCWGALVPMPTFPPPVIRICSARALDGAPGGVVSKLMKAPLADGVQFSSAFILIVAALSVTIPLSPALPLCPEPPIVIRLPPAWVAAGEAIVPEYPRPCTAGPTRTPLAERISMRSLLAFPWIKRLPDPGGRGFVLLSTVRGAGGLVVPIPISPLLSVTTESPCAPLESVHLTSFPAVPVPVD